MMKNILPPLTAGLVAVLVGFSSTVALIYQAATASGASTQEASLWLSALCLGSGFISLFYSWRYKMPILAAWSTPGAALLVGVSGFTLAESVGAFIFSGVLITLMGVTGVFERILSRIPVSLASAMLVGILFKFGLEVFVSMKTRPELILSLFLVYLFSKRFLPRYAILIVLFVGICLSWVLGLLHFEGLVFESLRIHPVAPEFSLSALMSIGLPLFLVTMASQNLPGVVTLRSFGYHPPISPLIAGSGVVTVLLSPFGGFGVNLAAITAAICMGKEAHEDPSKRYLASMFAGGFYIVLAILGGAVGAVLSFLPKELILTLAGLALFSTIGNGLGMAMSQEKEREPALVTFLATASGVSFFGIGSAFWGIIAGGATLLILRFGNKN